jgi:hypothetical protein
MAAELAAIQAREQELSPRKPVKQKKGVNPYAAKAKAKAGALAAAAAAAGGVGGASSEADGKEIVQQRAEHRQPGTGGVAPDSPPLTITPNETVPPPTTTTKTKATSRLTAVEQLAHERAAAATAAVIDLAAKTQTANQVAAAIAAGKASRVR